MILNQFLALSFLTIEHLLFPLQPYQFREYEKYLRLENLKWEPPGTCYGEYHNKKIDVYSLMLLIWEMCTGKYILLLLFSV